MGKIEVAEEFMDRTIDLNKFKEDLFPDVDFSKYDTLPKLMRLRYQQFGDNKVWMTHKDFGIWQPHTWKDCYEHIELVFLGLVSLGLEHGDVVGIIGDNDPRWFWPEFAVQVAGGVVAGMYVDYHYEELKYILSFSKAKFVFAKDQEMMDKVVVNMKEGLLPDLKKAIYWEAKGLWFYDYDWMMGYDELEDLGREYKKSHPNLFEESIDKTDTDDPAVLMLSSGTTRLTEDGVPRSQMGIVTHRSLIANVLGIFKLDTWYPTDRYLSFLSPAWGEQVFGFTTSVLAGNEIDFPEEPETIINDIREIAPQAMFAGARFWEGRISDAMSRLADSSRLKRFFYDHLLPIGYKHSPYMLKGQKAPLWLRIANKIAYWIVFRPLRDQLGLLHIRHVYTMGAILGPESIRWIHALGIPLKQLYGTTETGIYSIHPDGDIDYATVGKLLNPDWLKVSDDGEILHHGALVGGGFLNDLDGWRKKFDKEGWYHTGDAGFINERGHLIFYDRMADMVTVPSGKKFSPQYVESRLKFSPYIKDAVVVGGPDKPFVSAIVMVDYLNAGDWAEKHRIAYTTYPDLSQKPGVYDLVKGEMDRVNQYLEDEVKIKKFVNLHKEFDADDAELTRSGKIRRKFMEERYKNILDSIYAGDEKYETEAPVKYRDGRMGKIKTAVTIKTV